ncbi:MAG: hypothetical protein U5K69_15810 [Balneolaceae bacterium]|nr:hypothetical protein [Balneolaceae bacterium]
MGDIEIAHQQGDSVAVSSPGYSAGFLEVNGNETMLQEFDQLLKDIPQRKFDKLVVYFSAHPDTPYSPVTDSAKIMLNTRCAQNQLQLCG